MQITKLAREIILIHIQKIFPAPGKNELSSRITDPADIRGTSYIRLSRRDLIHGSRVRCPRENVQSYRHFLSRLRCTRVNARDEAEKLSARLR